MYDTRVVPHDPEDIEERAFYRGEYHRQEAENQAARQREAQLHVAHRDLRSDQLVELGASGLRPRLRIRDALMVAERPGGVAANQLGAAEEYREAIGVATEAAEHQPADGDRERPEEEIPPVIDQARGELPAAD